MHHYNNDVLPPEAVIKRKMRFYLYTLLLLIFIVDASSSPRITYTINEGWSFAKGTWESARFHKFDDSKWQIVNIPHTWNTEDAVDDTPGYYRGESWYRKTISIPLQYRGKQTFIYFEGSNQETEVFVNGKSVGSHIGGYTRFCFNITQYLEFGKENVFSVKVNNRHNESIPPLAADFTFWGGIYRDIYLEFTDELHFTKTDFASSGIYVNSEVSKEKAEINIKALVTNKGLASSIFQVETTLIDPKGTEVAKNSVNQNLAANSNSAFKIPSFRFSNPILWSPETPSLYRIRSRIYDKKHTLIDEVVTTIGLRWYHFSPDSGFYLNGKSYKLIGTNRHQDYLRKGSALRDEMHVRDIQLLKEMGGNFLRISHYPQDPVVMEMCDKLGILTSVEIPIVSTISESEAFHNNSLAMAAEMVMQDYNHPSIIIWGYMNEVLLHPLYKTDSLKQQVYFKSVHRLAQDLDNLIRNLDSKRYTMMACNGNFEDYHKVGLDKIPQILGWNLYQGWYSGIFSDFDKFLENVHTQCPDKSLLVSEYGVDVDSRLHSFQPTRFDFTVEYGSLYHEHYLKAIMDKPYIAGATIWNLNDFYSEARKDAVPHVNNKGITELDRQLKDTYLLYQCRLKQDPIVKMGSGSWKTRGGVEDPLTQSCVQPIIIYTNRPSVDVYLNGKFLERKEAQLNVIKIDVPFKAGKNVIEAVSVQNDTIRDITEIDFKMIPHDLSKFTEINVLLGSKRYFEDRDAAMIWIPEKQYHPGSWGYIGGRPYEKKTRRGTLNNSDKDICDTDQDPIYQGQRVGIDSFKLDLPNGQYSIYCYWASLKSKERDVLIYNLGNDALNTDGTEDIFNLQINGETVLYDFNPQKESKDSYSIIKKFNINVTDGKGLTMTFQEKKGESLLNALRIYRNY